MTKTKRDIHAEVTAQIIAKLEDGVAPWTKSWTGGGFVLPRRSTGQHYRGINIMLLMMQGRSSEHWFTYKQAEALGAQVRKGEKGTMVIFYKKLNIKDKETGEPKSIPMLRAYTVFNYDQIDGLPAEYDAAPAEAVNPDVRSEALEAYIAATGAKVAHGGSRAYYSPTEDRVQLPDFEQFHDGIAYYGTALHELAHWTGHPSRLDRLTKRDSTSYATEELVAELSAAFLGASLGVEATLREDHVSYLDGWLKVLKADNKAIFKAATAAQKAVDYLDGTQPQELEEAA